MKDEGESGEVKSEKKYHINQVIRVRDRVRQRLIRRSAKIVVKELMIQSCKLEQLISNEHDVLCTQEFKEVPVDIVGTFAATRLRILNSVSDYELIQLIARAICELEVPETEVTDTLFETCMYFYTQKKFMRYIRLVCLEERVINSGHHKDLLSRIRQQKNLAFSVETDSGNMEYLYKLVSGE